MTKPFLDSVAFMGGAGNMIALIIAIFIVSRREDYKKIAKIGFIPALFNISEPIMFGLPVVMNPILIIPMILSTFIGLIIGTLATSIGLMAHTYILIPWTTPPVLSAFFATGGHVMSALIAIIILVISVLIYMPFLALDLDGTLINEKNEIIGGNETLSLLKGLQENGYEVVIVTGRLDHDIIYIAQKYDLNIKYRISQNGAVVQDNYSIKGRMLSKETAINIYEYINKRDLRVEMNTISNRYWHSDRGEDFPREFYDSSNILEDFTEAIYYQPIVLFLLIGDKNEINNVRKYIEENFDDVDAIKTSDKTLEVIPKGVSKGKTLKEIYPNAEIISIGDSENDFSMFPYSKTSYFVGKHSFGEADFYLPSIREALKSIVEENNYGK